MTKPCMSALDIFFAEHQRRAFLYCRYRGLQVDDALDVVQDAMFKCYRHAKGHDEASWPALFYTILRHALVDWQRKAKLKAALFFWQPASVQEEVDVLEDMAASHSVHTQLGLEHEMAAEHMLTQLQHGIAALSEQQRDVFLHRCLHGLSEQQTADVVGIGIGSVKSQYFRAKQTILKYLGGANENAA